MFTVEFDTDSGDGITVTTLDDTNNFDDVELILYDDQVFIKQVDDHEGVQLINLSVQQLNDILCAMSLPEGSYYQSNPLKGTDQ